MCSVGVPPGTGLGNTGLNDCILFVESLLMFCDMADFYVYI